MVRGIRPRRQSSDRICGNGRKRRARCEGGGTYRSETSPESCVVGLSEDQQPSAGELEIAAGTLRNGNGINQAKVYANEPVASLVDADRNLWRGAGRLHRGALVWTDSRLRTEQDRSWTRSCVARPGSCGIFLADSAAALPRRDDNPHGGDLSVCYWTVDAVPALLGSRVRSARRRTRQGSRSEGANRQAPQC